MEVLGSHRGDAEKDFVLTSSGNLIHKTVDFICPSNLSIGGKVLVERDVKIDARKARINIGRYCNVKQKAVIRTTTGEQEMNIGNHVLIKEGSVVESRAIGDHVIIGKNCFVPSSVVICDNVVIQDDTRLPEDLKLAPFSLVGGCPARILSRLPDTAEHSIKNALHIDLVQAMAVSPM